MELASYGLCIQIGGAAGFNEDCRLLRVPQENVLSTKDEDEVIKAPTDATQKTFFRTLNNDTFHSNPPYNHTSHQPFSFNVYGLKALSFATLLLDLVLNSMENWSSNKFTASQYAATKIITVKLVSSVKISNEASDAVLEAQQLVN